MGAELHLYLLTLAEKPVGIAHGRGAYRSNAGLCSPRREKPRGSVSRSLNPLGVLSRSSSGRGPDFVRASPLTEASGCAIRRPPPRCRGVLQALRPASRHSVRRSRRIPARSGDPRHLRFPFGLGLSLPSGFPFFQLGLPSGFPFFQPWPSCRFPDLPADLPDGFPSLRPRRRVSPST